MTRRTRYLLIVIAALLMTLFAWGCMEKRVGDDENRKDQSIPMEDKDFREPPPQDPEREPKTKTDPQG